jgi:hypothetical protein
VRKFSPYLKNNVTIKMFGTGFQTNAVKLRKKLPLLLERVGVRRINTGKKSSNSPSS